MKLFVTSHGDGWLAIINVISALVTNWFLRDSESESEIPPPLKVIIFEKKTPPKQLDTVDGSEILRSPVEVSSLHYLQIFDMFDTSQVVMAGFQPSTVGDAKLLVP